MVDHIDAQTSDLCGASALDEYYDEAEQIDHQSNAVDTPLSEWYAKGLDLWLNMAYPDM